MFLMNIFVYLAPLLFLLLLHGVYRSMEKRVVTKNARDRKFILSGFRTAFIVTTAVTTVVLFQLIHLYVTGSLFVHDILLFYFILPFLMCVVFLSLCAMATVVSSIMCISIKKGQRATDKKIYSFSSLFRITALAVTIITAVVAVKYANYIYATYRVDSLNASEEELRKIYPRAVKLAPLYLDVLHLISHNRSCTPDLIRLYVTDIDNVKISESDKVSILSAIIENPRTPMDVLNNLVSYKDSFVSQKARFYIEAKLKRSNTMPASQISGKSAR